MVLRTLSEAYTSNTFAKCGRAPSGYHILKKKNVKAFLASSERVVRRSQMTVTGREGTETDTGSGTVLLVSVSEGFRRITSPCQVSTFPPDGEIKFLLHLLACTTDTHKYLWKI